MGNKSLSKRILKGLLLTGAICIAASSPYFAFYLSRNFWRTLKRKRPFQKDKRFENAFYYLKRKGFLDVQKKNHQIYISLTAEGKKKAKKYQIDDLEIKRPKKWDGRYRIVLFDIPNITRIKRDALRGKLKELGFFRLQQSVWVHAYNCRKEIDFLRRFFGLGTKELILIEGVVRNDKFLRKFFKLFLPKH